MKIDVNAIAGYAEMTAEQRVEALLNYEVPDDSEKVNKLKAAFDNAAAEASRYKKELRDKMSEQERLAAERAEAEQALRAELEGLRKDKAIQNYTTKCLEVGYTPELARATGQAIADGDIATVFANLKTFIDERTRTIEANALNKQPAPTPGAAPSQKSVEDAENEKLRKAFGL